MRAIDDPAEPHRAAVVSGVPAGHDPIEMGMDESRLPLAHQLVGRQACESGNASERNQA